MSVNFVADTSQRFAVASRLHRYVHAFSSRIIVTEDLSWQREVGLQGTPPISTAVDQPETLQRAQTKTKPTTTGAHASNRERRALDTSRCKISVSWSDTLDNR